MMQHQSHGQDSEWRPKVQVPPGQYGPAYDDWDKWVSYYWQTRQIVDRSLRDVLEVGIGSSVVSEYLRRNGVNLTTIDIDLALGPDCVASVTDLPFRSDAFDAVLCAEVLEHMPFEHSRRAIREIHRVTRRFAFITLPRCVLSFAFLVRVPVIQLREFVFRIPYPKRPRPTGEHYWESGLWGYPLSRIRREFATAGFRVLSEQRPPTNYSHWFFVLAKPDVAR